MALLGSEFCLLVPVNPADRATGASWGPYTEWPIQAGLGWARGHRKGKFSSLGRQAKQAKNQKRIFRTEIFLLFFIADLNSARREEANEISSAWFLFLFALLCINRQFLWGLTSRIACGDSLSLIRKRNNSQTSQEMVILPPRSHAFDEIFLSASIQSMVLG